MAKRPTPSIRYHQMRYTHPPEQREDIHLHISVSENRQNVMHRSSHWLKPNEPVWSISAPTTPTNKRESSHARIEECEAQSFGCMLPAPNMSSNPSV